MTGFIYVAVVALSLLSGGRSAPVTSCESLIRPLEIQSRDQLLGNWVFSAESTNIKGSKALTTMLVESAWMRVTAANQSDAIDTVHYQKMEGRCFSLRATMNLANNTLSMVSPVVSSEVRLNSGCPDCLVFYVNYTIGRTMYRGLQLLSRRESVTAAELDEFSKQVECLNLPPPAILNQGKALCPDEASASATQTTDVTSLMAGMGADILKEVDQLIKTQGGLENLFNAIVNNMPEIISN